MMQFIHTIDAVEDESKTQTSRIVKPGDSVEYMGTNGKHYAASYKGVNPYWDLRRVYRNGRLLWQVGHTYAVQPGRGKKAVARIRILKIRMMDVREFKAEDFEKEGFFHRLHFFKVWCQMHDPVGLKKFEQFGIRGFRIKDRPAEHYNAWVLNFELVK